MVFFGQKERTRLGKAGSLALSLTRRRNVVQVSLYYMNLGGIPYIETALADSTLNHRSTVSSASTWYDNSKTLHNCISLICIFCNLRNTVLFTVRRIGRQCKFIICNDQGGVPMDIKHEINHKLFLQNTFEHKLKLNKKIHSQEI